MSSVRLRAFVASAALVALPVLGLSAMGTAAADTSPSVAETTAPPIIPLPTTQPTPSREPAPAPTATAVRTATPTLSPTPRRTRRPRATATPRPRATRTREPVAAPTTEATQAPAVVVTQAPAPTPTTPTKLPTKPAASATNDSSKIAKLIGLVVGAAVLLGLGGAAGLYLTRHHG